MVPATGTSDYSISDVDIVILVRYAVLLFFMHGYSWIPIESMQTISVSFNNDFLIKSNLRTSNIFVC